MATARKLGCVLPVTVPPAPRLGHYLDAARLTPPPATVDYHTRAAAGIRRVYLNDTLGTCVIAQAARAEGVWSAADGREPVMADDSEILAAYDLLKVGPGDSGVSISHSLAYQIVTGMTLGGVPRRVDGYVRVRPAPAELRAAVYLFGGLTLGIDLPRAWYDGATGDGFVWDAMGAYYSAGGHCVGVVGYDATGVQISTWGMVGTLTWAAMATRPVVEIYAVLGHSWYGGDRVASAVGFAADRLRDDLARLGAGVIPDAEPPLPPVEPPWPDPRGPCLHVGLSTGVYEVDLGRWFAAGAVASGGAGWRRVNAARPGKGDPPPPTLYDVLPGSPTTYAMTAAHGTVVVWGGAYGHLHAERAWALRFR